MKKTIIEIKEISDSKEVYGQRPNPFIPAFIYCLVGLLLAGLIYSFLGRIEMVATTSGVVRPNDDVSTVSSLQSGRVTNVMYSDGQLVRTGDPLFTIDTSEMQITLDGLRRTQADHETQLAMIEKFLSGIENGENPFRADPQSAEYPYYIQYQNFELSLQNAQDTFQYDADRNEENIRSINKQIGELELKIEGLNSYKNSVEQGTNLASAHPDYEMMYLLYTATLDKLETDYLTQKTKIEQDTSAESNRYYLDYYLKELAEYSCLSNSIQRGQNLFPHNSTSVCRHLYQDYLSNLEEYQRTYASASETYHHYLDGGSVGSNGIELLAYDKTMLEGYQYFEQSVINGRDMFSDHKDSVFYRSLYVAYQTEYDGLCATAAQALEYYELTLADPDATEEAGAAALSSLKDAEALRDNYKSSTLASIGNTILQIEASIAEKEIGIGQESLDYNIATAKIQMESAQAAIEAYRNRVLSEYSQMLRDIESKIAELNLAGLSIRNKDEQLAELDASYQNARQQHYYQTLTQIDNSLQMAEGDLLSAQSNLRMYKISRELFESNVDQNGSPISMSLATVEQISSLYGNREMVCAQLAEIEVQIQQVKEQISQGTIIAEQAGIVNATTMIVNGDMISSGVSIATIIPVNESEFKVQLYVSNADIANIEIGDPIKYNLAALPSNQYGSVDGIVTNISKDALVQNGQHSGYFLVEGSIANTELSDKDGNTGSVGIGMQVEAKIVTQEKSIIRYLLEKINLF